MQMSILRANPLCTLLFTHDEFPREIPGSKGIQILRTFNIDKYHYSIIVPIYILTSNI